MAKLGINTGTTPNDGTGDTLLDAVIKINSNFTEIYNTLGNGTNLVSYATTAGISTTSQGLTGTPNITVGVITATSGVQGIGIYSGGSLVTTGIVTALNFVGTGNTFAVVGNRVDISIAGGAGAGSTAQFSRTITTFTATSNQTTFSVAYTVGYVDVYLNGARLSSSEFTASDGSTVVLVTGATLNDVVDIISYGGTGTALWNVGTGSSIYSLSYVGIGTTNATSTLTVGGNVSISGVVTASSFSGNATSATSATSASYATIAGYSTNSGISTSVIGGISSVTQLSVSGVSTLGNGNVTVGAGNTTLIVNGSARVTGVTTIGNIVFNGQDGSSSIGNNSGTMIVASAGNMQLRVNSSSSNLAMVGNSGGSVDLYHNNVMKMSTTSVGSTVYGTLQSQQLNVSGVSTFGGAIRYGGVTLSNSVTGTESMVLSSSPSLTTPSLGDASASRLTISGASYGNGGLSITAAEGITLRESSFGATNFYILPSPFGGSGQITLIGATPSGTRTVTVPDATGTIILSSDKLSALSATTSTELRGVISDETGSGSLVFATSPTLVTPNIGAASATTLNVSGVATFSSSVTVNGNLNAPGNYYVKLARTSNQTIPTGTDTLIGFTTMSDTNGWYSGITTRTTPTVAGNYQVQAMLNWQAGATTNANQSNIQLRKNGNTFAISIVGIQTFQYSQFICGIVTMNGTTDYIEFTAYTSNATSQAVTGDAGATYTKMEIFKLN